jgi:hypothetical protein
MTHLHLHSGDVLHSVSLSSLYHLKLDTCSLNELKAIFKNAPELQSLNIYLELKTPDLAISLTSSHLSQLNLKITS